MEVITRTPCVQVPQIAWNLLAELPERESDLVVGRRVDCICAPLFVLCRHHRALLRLSRSLLRHRRMVRLLDLGEVLCIVFWWRSRFPSKVYLDWPNSPWHTGAGIKNSCTHCPNLLPAVSHQLTITVSQLHMDSDWQSEPQRFSMRPLKGP